MTDDQKAIGLAIVIVVIVLAVLRSVIKKIRTPTIEKIIEPDSEASPYSPAAIVAVPLLLFSAWSVVKYLLASDTNEQIVALLMWIANGVFWGVFFLGCLIVPIIGRKRDDAG